MDAVDAVTYLPPLPTALPNLHLLPQLSTSMSRERRGSSSIMPELHRAVFSPFFLSGFGEGRSLFIGRSL